RPGLERAPEYFNDLLTGGNFGKMVVAVGAAGRGAATVGRAVGDTCSSTKHSETHAKCAKTSAGPSPQRRADWRAMRAWRASRLPAATRPASSRASSPPG